MGNSIPGRRKGSQSRHIGRRLAALREQAQRRNRRIVFETLESRQMLASLPFGAAAADTGEYLLGKTQVNVVLLESDSSLAPFDDFSSVGQEENWNPSQIASVKQKITEGVNWWVQTYENTANAIAGLVSFNIDFTHADVPVHTGYEPIARPSYDDHLWIDDFLASVGYNSAGSDTYGNLKAYNNAQRLANDAEWSFTIFVVNDANDPDGRFAQGNGTGYGLAYAYPGGLAIVLPSSRPANTVAHETGHQFWAMDEYDRLNNQQADHRGYYDTANANAAPPPYVQQPSIMSGGSVLSAAYAANVTSTSSRESIGWKDSDGDGIPDVLDVAHSLTGEGTYNSSTLKYHFEGYSQVRTLVNKNPEGLQNDITINKIRQVQYSIDSGSWVTLVGAVPTPNYTVNLNFDIPLSPSTSQLQIRTIDTRTGVVSDIFTDNLTQYKRSTENSGISGYVFNDYDSSGDYGSSKVGLAGWTVSLTDSLGAPKQLRKTIEPNNYAAGSQAGSVGAALGVNLTTIGSDAYTSNVYFQTARYATAAVQAFANDSTLGHFNSPTGNAAPTELWNSTRKLQAAFTTTTGNVSITAFGTTKGNYARVEVYNSAHALLERYTTGFLTRGQSEVVTLTRAQGDIAYLVAYGSADTDAVLDTLSWGSENSVLTDSSGFYSFPSLLTGTFYVHATPPADSASTYTETFPFGNAHLVGFHTGSSASYLNFGFQTVANPWRYSPNPLNVSGSNGVTPLDALQVINWLNSHSATNALTGSPGNGIGFIDVNGDNFVTALDALQVINFLNAPPKYVAGPALGIDGHIGPTGYATPTGEAASGSGLTASASTSSSLLVQGEDAGIGSQSLLVSTTTIAGLGTLTGFSTSSPTTVSNRLRDLLYSGGCTCRNCVGTALGAVVSQSTTADSSTCATTKSSSDKDATNELDLSPQTEDGLLTALALDISHATKFRRSPK